MLQPERDNMMASGELTLSVDEIDQFDTCGSYRELRERLLRFRPDTSHGFSAKEAKQARCSYKDILWAAARKAQTEPAVRRRLTGFVNDCATKVLPIIELDRSWDDRPRKAIFATRDFLAGTKSLPEWQKIAADGLQGFAERAAPEAIVADGFWAAVGNSHGRYSGSWRSWTNPEEVSDEWRDWFGWARWAVWLLAAVDHSWEYHLRREADLFDHEAELARLRFRTRWLMDRLLKWLSPTPPSPLRIPKAPAAPPANPPAQHHSVMIDEIEMGWFDIVVLPSGTRAIDTVRLERNAYLQLPDSVHVIRRLSLTEHPELVPGCDLSSVGFLDLSYGTSIDLPPSLSSIGHAFIECGGNFSALGLKEIGDIEISWSDVVLPDGVKTVGNVKIEAGTLKLPSTVTSVGSIEIRAEDPEVEGKIELNEGILEIGEITLDAGVNIVIPSSILIYPKIRILGEV